MELLIATLFFSGILLTLAGQLPQNRNQATIKRRARPTHKDDYTVNPTDREEIRLKEIRNATGNEANRSLEKRLKNSRRTQKENPRPIITAWNIFLILAGSPVLLYGAFITRHLVLEEMKQSSNSTPNQANSSHQSTATPSKEPTRQPSEPTRPPERIDPAAEIKPFISTYSDSRFPNLNDLEQYRRGAGDLARVHERMLRDRSRARQYPSILIGAGKFTGNCAFPQATIGAYRLDCKTIQINFTDGNVYYEYPIEILATLAHEYAHHLVNITIGTKAMSGLENELLADCFAGLMIGYWDKYSKVSEQEKTASAEMMIQVSKKEGLNFTDNHGDPGQRLGAFLGGYLRAAGEPSPQYENFCRSLDRIIDWDKGLP